MTASMKCISIAAWGGPEVLVPHERAIPVPGEGEVLIRVSASGINRPDVLQRLGHYPVPPGASDLPGLEVSGTIEAGDRAALAAAGLSVGQSVCALLAGGGYAQYCVAPVLQCLPLPQGVTAIEAATLPETFFTVWSNVFDRARLQRGQTLLIQGGSSGIGVTAIQMARAAGASVIATAGSEAKCQAILRLGANHAINYRTSDFSSQVQDLTQGRGVDVILDMVAGDYVPRELACLAEDGTLVFIAMLGGVKCNFDAGLVLRRRLHITGSTLRPRSVAFKGAIAAALKEKVWPQFASGDIRPVVYRTFDALGGGEGLPSGAARAHALMERGEHIGKIALTW